LTSMSLSHLAAAMSRLCMCFWFGCCGDLFSKNRFQATEISQGA
jgi:hypothetical protein